MECGKQKTEIRQNSKKLKQAKCSALADVSCKTDRRHSEGGESLTKNPLKFEGVESTNSLFREF